jgi:ABC-type multidrug transport system ATPase subunit
LPLQLFDRLHLMSDGQTIFFGATSEAVAYFESAGYKCPPLWNAADFLLDLIATDYRSAEAEKETKARVAALYQKNLEREGACTPSYDYAEMAAQADAAGQRGKWTAVRVARTD